MALLPTAKTLIKETHVVPAALAEGNRETVQDRVYRKISNLLLCGYFRPGESVSLRQLSAALSVSETPVRSALNRLLADNAIDVLPNRYFCVPAISRSEFDELIDLRLMLEKDLMRHAYRNVSRQDVRELERINDVFVQARDKLQQQATLEANVDFHFKLYALADRPMSLSLVRSVWLRVGSIIGMALRAGGARWGDDFHSVLIDGLKTRDEDKCLKAIEGDIRHTFDLVRGLENIDIFQLAL